MTTRLEFDVLANDRATTKLDKIARGFGQFGTLARNAGNTAAGGLGRMGAAAAGAAKMGAAGLVVLGGAAVAAVPKLVDAAGNLELMGKKAQTVFGSELGSVEKWAKANANAMGTTKREAVGLAAGFADLLIPMGFTRKQGADMATEMIGLSGALAEWSGGTKSAAEVADILSAAMLGERDALQGLGISISQAEVEAKALQMGLAKGEVNMNQVNSATVRLEKAQTAYNKALKEHGKDSVEARDAATKVGLAQDAVAKATKGSKAEISEQAAALATQQLIMEKSKDAQTAYANGAGTLARKTAESKAKLREMGQELLVKATPALTKAADVVGTKLLPKLEKFGSWVGENKFEIADAFIEIGLAVTGLVSMFGPAVKFMDNVFLDFVGNIVNGAAEAFGWIPEIGPKLQTAQEKFNQYRTVHDKAFDGLIDKAGDWNEALKKMQVEVKLKADISNWEAQLKKAKTQIGDKNLSKERRAQLTATIADLEKKIRTAKGQLAQPDLVKTRTAKLEADKRALDKKIADAKAALASPSLTKERAAKLNADIRELLRKKAQAQAAINALKGKTVVITYAARFKQGGGALPGQQSDPTLGGLFPGGKAGGGSVRPRTPYWVGERRPEVFVPDGPGTIQQAMPGMFGGAAGLTVKLEVGSTGGRMEEMFAEMIRRFVKLNGGNVQDVFGR